MREFIKGLLCLIVLAGVIVTLFAWGESRPNHTTWTYRIVGPAAAVVGLGAFVVIHFRKDVAPDFLHAAAGNYFDRGGFCFAFAAGREEGVFVLNVLFQNRFERPCRGRIALRPARGFFLTRSKIDTIRCDIECAAGAFGVARLKVPLPVAMQGTRQKFDVGASVDYPDGRGRRLRNREGLQIGNNTNFGDAFGKALALTGAAAGVIVINHPASVTIELPTTVTEECPPDGTPEVSTWWVLGDPTDGRGDAPALGTAELNIGRPAL